jgi:hypothetical protein
MHSGQGARNTSRLEGKYCIQARQGAKYARQGNAKFAPHMSAGFARDSY